MTAMGQIRSAVQRWCVENAGAGVPPAAFGQLDMENPNLVAGAQFGYVFPAVACGPPVTGCRRDPGATAA
jgi:hypothetical protein